MTDLKPYLCACAELKGIRKALASRTWRMAHGAHGTRTLFRGSSDTDSHIPTHALARTLYRPHDFPEESLRACVAVL